MVTKSVPLDLGSHRGDLLGALRSVIPQNEELGAWNSRKTAPEEPSFEEVYGAWLEAIRDLKEIAAANLYECEEVLTHGDLWMHRLLFVQRIMDIQIYILKYFGEDFAGKEIDSPLPNLLAKVEEQIMELVDTLHEWHGSPQSQSDMPAEFIESMEEALMGDVKDFDQGIHARFGGIK